MQEYERYEQDKKNVNDSCRRRAVSNMNLHFQNKKEEKIQASIQNVMISLFRAIGLRNFTESLSK